MIQSRLGLRRGRIDHLGLWLGSGRGRWGLHRRWLRLLLSLLQEVLRLNVGRVLQCVKATLYGLRTVDLGHLVLNLLLDEVLDASRVPLLTLQRGKRARLYRLLVDRVSVFGLLLALGLR